MGLIDIWHFKHIINITSTEIIKTRKRSINYETSILWNFNLVKLQSCETSIKTSGETSILWNFNLVKLQSCETETSILWNFNLVKLQSCETSILWNFNLVKLQSCETSILWVIFSLDIDRLCLEGSDLGLEDLAFEFWPWLLLILVMKKPSQESRVGDDKKLIWVYTCLWI